MIPTDETPRLLNDMGTSTEAPSTCETAVWTNYDTPTCTANAVTQMALQDEPPHPLRDAGTSTGTLSPSQTTPCRTVPIPQPALPAAMPQQTTPAQPDNATSQLSVSLTTATTVSPPPSKRPVIPQKRRHTLPDRPTAPLQAPQPLVSRPEPSTAVATARTSTPTPSTPTTSKTASRATATSQTAATTSETANQAVRNAPRPSVAQPMRSDERFIHLTDEFPRRCKPQQRPIPPPMAPSYPQLVPLSPIPPESPGLTARSPSTRLSTTSEFPIPPSSRPRAAAEKRQDTLPEPSEQPRSPPTALSHSTTPDPPVPLFPEQRNTTHTPVMQHEPTVMPHASTGPPTSSTTCLSSTAESPALPHSGPQASALKRQDPLLESSEHPHSPFQSPGSPQNPSK
jgi:hypothetical protein